ncbi:globin family protein [Mesobacterium pallidum]|uniref:globin family protein n=1 Tax=Mesobacterium pallidum TaxID=2872037 RepID=UPI001EE366B8|nr:globin family protein [Mesobacterium pallidum]
MTPRQIDLVQSTFRRIAPLQDVAADMFYARLFEIAPQLRPLFPEDMRSQKTMLMQMLSAAVTGLRDMDSILPALTDLGARHQHYKVQPQHYDFVGAALLETLREALGPDFTPEVEDAWAETYALLAGVMKGAQRAAA